VNRSINQYLTQSMKARKFRNRKLTSCSSSSPWADMAKTDKMSARYSCNVLKTSHHQLTNLLKHTTLMIILNYVIFSYYYRCWRVSVRVCASYLVNMIWYKQRNKQEYLNIWLSHSLFIICLESDIMGA
jgi:hypothetical protein